MRGIKQSLTSDASKITSGEFANTKLMLECVQTKRSRLSIRGVCVDILDKVGEHGGRATTISGVTRSWRPEVSDGGVTIALPR